MTLDQFVTKYQGRYLEYNNDIYKNQCLDLFWQYLKEVLGIDPRPYQGWGSAKNVYNNTYRIKDFNKNFTKVANGPNNIPKKGDAIFWGTYPGVTGWAGHVAIYLKGDLYIVYSFDENYPTGSRCAIVKHGYNKLFHGYRGVMGWFHKK